MEHRYVEYEDNGTLLEGYFVTPGGSDLPLILVAHDWTGRRQYAIDKANEMADRGYAAFALDMYGKGVFGRDGDVEYNSSLMGPFAMDRLKLRQRVHAALTAGRAQPEVNGQQVAAIGYCFGGMCVLELARSGADVLGVVSVHGIFSPGEVANEAMTSKVLCLHGHDDPMVPPEQVVAFEQEMTAAGVDWQMHVYGATTHAFTNPGANNPDFGTVYSERANRRADQSTTDFFEEIFN
jgi:dienelactone hydrolase